MALVSVADRVRFNKVVGDSFLLKSSKSRALVGDPDKRIILRSASVPLSKSANWRNTFGDVCNKVIRSRSSHRLKARIPWDFASKGNKEAPFKVAPYRLALAEPKLIE